MAAQVVDGMGKAFFFGALMALGAAWAVPASAETPEAFAEGMPLPSVRERLADLEVLAELARRRVVVVHQEPERYRHPGLPERPIEIVQAFTLVNAPAAQVRARFLDFQRHAAFMPQVIDSEPVAREARQWLVDFELSFRMPLLHVTPEVRMRYWRTPEGEVWSRQAGGDFAHSMARWAFLSLGPDRTLLVKSSWADVGSASWLLDMAFYAQPDLRRLSPVAAAALTLQALRHEIETDYLFRERALPRRAGKSSARTALLPELSEAELSGLTRLAREATVALVAPLAFYRREGEAHPFQPVTTATLASVPQAQARERYRDLRAYPERIAAVREVTALSEKGRRHFSDWSLGFDFALFTLGIDFSVAGHWNEPRTRFNFFSPEGDFHFLAGRWQWQRAGEDRTLALFSSTHEVGDDAGFILNAIKGIPFSQMFAGIFVGRQLVDGQRVLLEGREAAP